MRLFIIFAFLISISCQKLHAQNLVPNPSFEDTVSCPTTANQMDKCSNWYSSRGSPDYFNECDFITGNTSIPSNFQGFQYAKSGNAYCGLIAYYRPAPNQREYITCELLNPLIIGKNYNISFYISLANNYYRLASNKFGMFFSTNNYNSMTPAPIGNYAQFYSDSIVSDTLNWIHITGNFIADSNYIYLSIGNFFTDINTDTIYNPPASYSYYYLDDLSITEDSLSFIYANNNNEYVKIYPNPSKDIIFIKTNNSIIQWVEVIDMKGIRCQKIKNIDNVSSLKFNLECNSPGMYILIVHFENSTQHYKISKL